MAVKLPNKIVTLTPDERKTYRTLNKAFHQAESDLNQWLRKFKETHGPSETSSGGYAPFYNVEMAMMDDHVIFDDEGGTTHAVFERTLRS